MPISQKLLPRDFYSLVFNYLTHILENQPKIKMLTYVSVLVLAATAAMANPIVGLTARQPDPFARVTNVATRGNDCGRISVVRNDTSSLVRFENYRAFQPPDLGREKLCDVIFTIHFPIGCTALIFDNSLSGEATLSPGVTGRVHRNFILDHGGLLSNPNPDVFPITSSGEWSKADASTAEVTINTPNQQDVLFTVQTRIALQGSGSSELRVGAESLGLIFQRPCQ
jgi:hypothetical protein